MKDLKKWAGAALILFAVASGVYVVLRDGASAAEDGPVPAGADLVVYFFDQGKDCATCENIPAYTQAVLEDSFGDALASGRIVWRVVDVEAAENAHFVEDFGLFAKAIVLVRMASGRQVAWKNLDRVWDLVYDQAGFVAYIREEVAGMLETPA
ncbi:MAG: hypothetical protein IT368_06475 [Candidatus Hydrogenedentes bacterium]|nr:hypothetical protein [Candidatus Hydrogenedentota bacterium]